MSDDSKRPRSVDLGFCPIKTLGFRRRGLFDSRESTLISQAIPQPTPGFLALSETTLLPLWANLTFLAGWA